MSSKQGVIVPKTIGKTLQKQGKNPSEKKNRNDSHKTSKKSISN